MEKRLTHKIDNKPTGNYEWNKKKRNDEEPKNQCTVKRKYYPEKTCKWKIRKHDKLACTKKKSTSHLNPQQTLLAGKS